VSVHVFVEGGGPRRRTQTECRRAFRLFFEKLLADRPRPRVSACGSRNETYQDFCRSVKHDHDTLALLLVDAEDPVPDGKTPRQHLRDRDQWTDPMPDQQVHLMVQCMESWFLADRPALEEYYGHGFRANGLPGDRNIETIPKDDVVQGLARASKDTDMGEYHKTRHGFAILERIDPTLVCARSPHAKAFFSFLLSQLS
jgi:hypothetical protein